MPFWNVWVTKIAKALILLVLQDSFLTNLLLLSFGKIVLAKELWLNMRNLFWWWPYFAKKMCKYYQFANQWNSNALKEAKHEKFQCYQLCQTFSEISVVQNVKKWKRNSVVKIMLFFGKIVRVGNTERFSKATNPLSDRSGWEIFPPRKIHIGSYWRSNNKVDNIYLL